MCYKCKVCGDTSAHGSPQLRFTVYRKLPSRMTTAMARDHYNGGMRPTIVEEPVRKEISAEYPVCRSCHHALTVEGVPLRNLVHAKSVYRKTVVVNRPDVPQAVSVGERV